MKSVSKEICPLKNYDGTMLKISDVLEKVINRKHKRNYETVSYISAVYTAIMLCHPGGLEDQINVDVIWDILIVLNRYETYEKIVENTNLYLVANWLLPRGLSFLGISVRDFITFRFAVESIDGSVVFEKGDPLPSGWVDATPGRAKTLIDFEKKYAEYVNDVYTPEGDNMEPPPSLINQFQLLNASLNITLAKSYFSFDLFIIFYIFYFY